MIDGLVTQEYLDLDEVMPYAPYPIYATGQRDTDKSINRYTNPNNQNPTLTLVDTIYDSAYNPVIPPGHYELALSDEYNFLLLIQSRKLVAKIPVFKFEEDENQAQKIYDKKEQTKIKKKQKKTDKIAKKYAERGLKPQPSYIYSNATIEYIEEGKYYLLKYEKGSLRAWGAIKNN